ncbi:LD-carboxypeptidase [Olivibacter ginsenosidimutans]|uniref:LD-carboxypeptidase n=1 Tax=Olivibacter ginsenosidimutans TaxID=1176537 RepID=A0ABP9BBB7_9SPHI
MDKRNFLRTLGTGLACTATLSPQLIWGAEGNYHMAPIYPKLLKKGDTVGIICPSGAIDDQLSFMLAQETFEALGFNVKWGDHVHERLGHLAGTDQARLADLHQMFEDDEIKAIICMRGGSGAARLLDKIDYQLIRRHPKIFLGYSDITSLHAAIHSQTGLITFHGAVGISSWTVSLAKQFEQLFIVGKPTRYENPLDKGNNLIPTQNRIQTITSGTASGKLLGGNLSVLTSIAGSAYFPDFTDSILFLEEVSEELYRIERMFCQLRLTGALTKIKGFIFGQCTDCNPAGGYGSQNLDQILEEYIKPLQIPAYQGAMIGHISNQFILPVGATIAMNANTGTFVVAEKVFR